MAKEQFEIHAMRDKRWVIETIMPSEQDAMLAAQKFLKEDNCAEVKIIRQTTGVMGHMREKEIFHQTRDDNKKAPLQMTGKPAEAFVCQTLTDCYELPARLSIMRLLGQYLDRFQITATELLHSSTFLRKLVDSDSLLGAAIHQVGMAQATKLNIEGKERSQQLQVFFAQVLERAKTYNEERRNFTGLRPEDYDYTYQRLRAQNPEQADYNFLATLSQHLTSLTARAAKQEELINSWVKSEEPQVVLLLDGIIADCISFPESVDELFGRQVSFSELLKIMADLLNGRLKENAKINPQLALIAAKIAEGKAPQCKEVLLERLLREIETDKPLDRRDPESEEKNIKLLEDLLKDEAGILTGGDPMKQALAARRLKERKKKLRDMGLHDAADAL